jgi:hypothetical protein
MKGIIEGVYRLGNDSKVVKAVICEWYTQGRKYCSALELRKDEQWSRPIVSC